MPRRYRYVGPEEIKNALLAGGRRSLITTAQDVLQWIHKTGRHGEGGLVVATYIIDTQEMLWIADRHSEHVVCAQGNDVLAAGEIAFFIQGSNLEVVEVSNQSTGYCPEPESLGVVRATLDRATIMHSNALTTALIFRKCDACGATNVIKEEWYECVLCGAELGREWNFGGNV